MAHASTVHPDGAQKKCLAQGGTTRCAAAARLGYKSPATAGRGRQMASGTCSASARDGVGGTGKHLILHALSGTCCRAGFSVRPWLPSRSPLRTTPARHTTSHASCPRHGTPLCDAGTFYQSTHRTFDNQQPRYSPRTPAQRAVAGPIVGEGEVRCNVRCDKI